MKKNLTLLAAAIAIGVTACNETPQEKWTDHAIDVAAYQLKQTATELTDSTAMPMPRCTWTGYDIAFLQRQLESEVNIDSLHPVPGPERLGKRRLCGIVDWTSGFFPGSLWYAYELTGDEALREQAVRYTNLLYPIRQLKGTHDIGFMINCSYGNALRLAPNDTISKVLIETAETLCQRFDPKIGCIRSWDFGKWNYPVIIDNMMNLDLLFSASKLSGDTKYRDIAISHARTTMKNHFRPDYTCYHVISYNPDGTVESRNTHQGKNDDSSWSRGQAWAAYGYTLCYRETNEADFLQQAIHVADMIMSQVQTNDSIPYWDYDAPATEETPRDASAAAVTASAFLELSTLAPDGQKYYNYAERLLKNLSSKNYLAEKGSNHGYVLMHSTGSLPHGSEIDTPINYADYYYLEALKRYLDMQK